MARPTLSSLSSSASRRRSGQSSLGSAMGSRSSASSYKPIVRFASIAAGLFVVVEIFRFFFSSGDGGTYQRFGRASPPLPASRYVTEQDVHRLTDVVDALLHRCDTIGQDAEEEEDDQEEEEEEEEAEEEEDEGVVETQDRRRRLEETTDTEEEVETEPTASVDPEVRTTLQRMKKEIAQLRRLGYSGKTTKNFLSESPQSRAAMWLAWEDSLSRRAVDLPPMEFQEEDEEAQKNVDKSKPVFASERYALATLYFATNGDTAWHKCSRTCRLCEEARTDDKHRFLSGDALTCAWYGVTCANLEARGHVTWIDLTDVGLHGTIPPELSLFSETLELLWLSNNNLLTGSIPRWIGSSIPQFQALSLYGTSMGGTIPDELYSATQMTSLRLYQSKFEGTLSSSLITQWKALSWLWLHGNQFTGYVPTQLGKLTKLEALTIHGNRFEIYPRKDGKKKKQDDDDVSDAVPPEVCQLKRKKKKLEHLWTECIYPEGSDELEEGMKPCSCCTRCFSSFSKSS